MRPLGVYKPFRVKGRVNDIAGGGGKIAIVTAGRLFIFCIALCLNIHQFVGFIYHLFYACLELRFPDVENNP